MDYIPSWSSANRVDEADGVVYFGEVLGDFLVRLAATGDGDVQGTAYTLFPETPCID